MGWAQSINEVGDVVAGRVCELFRTNDRTVATAEAFTNRQAQARGLSLVT